MTRYMLDTNICIYIIKKNADQVIQRLLQIPILNIAISSITLSELEFGVEKSLYKKQNRIALTDFISPLNILPYDDNAALEYGKIRAFLEKNGTPIGSLDMLIAGHAKAINYTLVTNNEKEFSRITGLSIENWTK